MRLVVLLIKLLSEPKIREPQMPIGIKQYILWLKIPIKYPLAMQELNRTDQFRQQLGGLPLRQPLAHEPPQVAKGDVLEGQVDILMGLKGIVQGDDVGAGP